MTMTRTVALLAAPLALLCAPAAAQRTASSLPGAATLSGSEKIVGSQGAGCATNAVPCATVNITTTQIATFLAGSFQPKDTDLDAIAALATQPFGRSLLTQADAAAVRSAIGLGSVAIQAANNVSITGGIVTGITDIAVADGGTGASTATAARANLGAGAPVHPGYLANRWYWSTRSPAQSGQSMTANQVRFAAMVLGQSVTITDVATRIGVTAATGNAQIAFYASDPVTRMPTGAPLATSANLSTASIAVVTAALSSAVTVGPGLIWIAINIDNATATITQSNAGNNPEQGFLIGATNAASLGTANTQASPVLYLSQTFGTWPTVTAGSLSEMAGTSPVIGFRVSAAN